MKVIAMIPARIGSQRVPKKNLRLIDGRPLIYYVVDSAIRSGAFDEIYINSDHEIFGKIADEMGVKFYKRPSHLGGHSSTNDEFALDFIENTDADILIQILPTSPLLTEKEIYDFTQNMISGEFDTLISVKHEQIACLYKNEPINFDKLRPNPPSQTMEPIKVYATALMGWSYKSFKSNMTHWKSAYHGGDKKTGYFELRGLSTIDVDREEDFLLAESIILSKKNSKRKEPTYYGETSSVRVETHVESILMKDGVLINNLYDVNHESINIEQIYQEMGKGKSWSRRVIDTENNSMTVISQLPGEGNRMHHHPDWNEWWYILDGEWEWNIEGQIKKISKGDIVFMQKGREHKITAIGNQAAVRMAVSRSDVAHVYRNEEG